MFRGSISYRREGGGTSCYQPLDDLGLMLHPGDVAKARRTGDRFRTHVRDRYRAELAAAQHACGRDYNRVYALVAQGVPEQDAHRVLEAEPELDSDRKNLRRAIGRLTDVVDELRTAAGLPRPEGKRVPG